MIASIPRRLGRPALLVMCLGVCSQTDAKGHERSNTGADTDTHVGVASPRKLRGPERLESATDRARYQELLTIISHNRHLGAHFVMAITVDTIKVVRKSISERDVPILIAMLSDKYFGAASAAVGLLVTLGMNAVPALLTVRRNDYYAAANAALALHSIRDCYSIDLWDRRDPDLCPTDRPAHRGQEMPTELPR